MSEEEKNIRIPVKDEEGKHKGHTVRTVVLSSGEGQKALYCSTCKKLITYIFAKNKNWTIDKAKEFVQEHESKQKAFQENHVDQIEEFISLTVTYVDGTVKVFIPNSESFVMNTEIEEATMGQNIWDDESEKARGDGQGNGGPKQGDGGASKCVCPECGKEYSKTKGKACADQKCTKCGVALVGKSNKSLEEHESNEAIDIIKLDKAKQIVYGVYLVPEKADHDGDVISEEDIEKVAHGFLVDYRDIDEMHKQLIQADIVESAIAWEDMNYYGKDITKGTWYGAIKVHDKDVWAKIGKGELKAFSVQIAGVREAINKEEL